jgi:hypothetical protein
MHFMQLQGKNFIIQNKSIIEEAVQKIINCDFLKQPLSYLAEKCKVRILLFWERLCLQSLERI